MQMGDDGYVNVPLQFPFPFYGQTFENSWMYDNGIVSFKQPGTQGALNPYQWSATPLINTNGTYFIAPLWADIAPKAGVTTYTVQGDTTYQKYIWTNIAEFYSLSGGVSPRLNTFSLTIKSDGSYNASYGGINLNTSNIAIGAVGNPAAGEINNVYYGQYGTQLTSITDWGYVGTIVTDPCKTNVLSSPSCPGYFEALAKINPIVVVTPPQTVTDSSTNSTGISTTLVTPTTTDTIITNTLVSTTPSESSITNTLVSTTTTTAVTAPTPTVSNPQPKVGDVQPAGSTNKPTVSLSTILGIIGAEQTRISDIEKNVVSSSVDQSWYITSQTTKDSELVSSSLTQQSITSSIQMASLGSLNTTNNLNNENQSTIQSTSTSFSKTDSGSIEQNNLEQQQSSQDEQDKKEQKQEVKKIEDNELSTGGVSLKSMAVTPKGYELYSYIIQDSPFYVSRDIYKRQHIVDNAKAMRLLNISSDIKHKEMIENQYKGY